MLLGCGNCQTQIIIDCGSADDNILWLYCRKLFEVGLRVLLREKPWLLRHSYLRAVVSDRRPVLDIVLASP